MSHVAIVERRAGSTFSPIAWGAKITPGEPIRFHAKGLKSTGARAADFYLRNWAGRALSKNTLNIVGLDDAWLDVVAPDVEGAYTFEVWANHSATATFQVSKDAPPPPPPPPATGIGGITSAVAAVTGSVKSLGLVALGLVGLIVVSRYLPKGKQ